MSVNSMSFTLFMFEKCATFINNRDCVHRRQHESLNFESALKVFSLYNRGNKRLHKMFSALEDMEL